jgi:hypothetical protein
MGAPMGGESGLGPTGDLHLIAAALRADRADVASYTRVLTSTLGAALPAGMVSVEHHRTVADRLAGRPGQPVAVTVRTPEQELELREGRHGEVVAEIRQVVRDVVIKRRAVPVDEWLVALAGVLAALAERSATARAALADLLGS